VIDNRYYNGENKEDGEEGRRVSHALCGDKEGRVGQHLKHGETRLSKRADGWRYRSIYDGRRREVPEDAEDLLL